MRGVSGSGKSTAARKLARGKKARIHSTDDFFYNSEGVYAFDPSLLQENHRKNFNAFIISLKKGFPIVICDNCNHKLVNYQKYLEAAVYFGYAVEIICMPHPTNEVAASRSIHNVPLATIERMLHLFEPND